MDFPILKYIEFSIDKSWDDPTISSQKEAGIKKTRPRFTLSIKTFPCNIRIDYSDYATFSNFVDSVHVGSTMFNWTHPITKAVHVVRFLGSPKLSTNPDNKGLYSGSYTVEEVGGGLYTPPMSGTIDSQVPPSGDMDGGTW